MKPADVPRINLWPYDIFGYLLPGALFLTAVAIGTSDLSDQIRATWNTKHWSNILLVVFGAYLTGTAIAALSSYLLERVLLRTGWYYPTARFYPNPEAKPALLALRTVMRRLKIVTVISPGYRKEYSPEMVKLTEDALTGIFGSTLRDDHDRFWLSWEYITLHHPIAYKRANHFLELYGFSRNSTMALLLVAGLPFLDRWQAWSCPMNWWTWSALSTLLAIVFYSNYTNVLRRMNNEVYRGLVAAWNAPPHFEAAKRQED